MFKSVVISLAIVLTIGSFAAAAGFPYRDRYPNMKYITTEELAAKDAKRQAIIVDVRSSIEYNVIHPVTAIHIALSKKSFIKEIEKLLQDNPGKDIVFYCNGETCLKSYEAAEMVVKELKSDRCYVYDAGIPEWARVHPELTMLLGKPLEDPSRLIPAAEFKSRCIPIDKMKAKAAEPNTLLIDVRDFIQASTKVPGLRGARTIPLDQFISSFVEKGAEKEKTLLIFDQVGKQTEWLMYYLKKNGYENYYFLTGGATAVLGEQKYK